MDELTLKSLAADLNALSDLHQQEVGALKTQVVTLESKLDSFQSKVFVAELKSTSGPAEKPVIPDTVIKRAKLSYKFAKAQFLLPGDPTKYTAEQAVTEKDKKDGLIDRILSIPGQKILVEAE